MTPTLYQSEAGVSVSASACSGAMYRTVPTTSSDSDASSVAPTREVGRDAEVEDDDAAGRASRGRSTA